MSVLDAILNLAGLLLWLKWLEKGQEISGPKISLLGTLKKTEPRHSKIWFLLALLMLLILRPFPYHLLGSAAGWIPRIWFGVIPISFRTDYLELCFLYSLLSFGSTLVIFYSCLLLLSALAHKAANPDAIQALVRENLWKLDRLPAWIKLLLPWCTMLLFWLVLNLPLVQLGLLPASLSWLHLIEQGVVAGLGIYLAWKYLIFGILLLHVLNSYIYFGPWPFWTFIDTSAREILRAISWIPLRIGKIDFAPLLGMALAVMLAEYGSRGLIWIYQRLPF